MCKLRLGLFYCGLNCITNQENGNDSSVGYLHWYIRIIATTILKNTAPYMSSYEFEMFISL